MNECVRLNINPNLHTYSEYVCVHADDSVSGMDACVSLTFSVCVCSNLLCMTNYVMHYYASGFGVLHFACFSLIKR